MFSLTVADALGLGGQGHVLRLHVGGKAGILLGGDVGGAELSDGAHTDGFGPLNIDTNARLLQAWQ